VAKVDGVMSDADVGGWGYMCAAVNITCQEQLLHCHFVDLSSLTLSILEDVQQIHSYMQMTVIRM